MIESFQPVVLHYYLMLYIGNIHVDTFLLKYSLCILQYIHHSLFLNKND